MYDAYCDVYGGVHRGTGASLHRIIRQCHGGAKPYNRTIFIAKVVLKSKFIEVCRPKQGSIFYPHVVTQGKSIEVAKVYRPKQGSIFYPHVVTQGKSIEVAKVYRPKQSTRGCANVYRSNIGPDLESFCCALLRGSACSH